MTERRLITSSVASSTGDTSYAMFIIVMLSLLLFPSVGQMLVQTQANSQPLDEAYQVYSTVIRKRYVNDSTKMILVFAETTPNKDRGSQPDRENLRLILMPLTQSTLDSYKENGKKVTKLEEKLDLPVTYTLITRAEFDEMFSRDNFSGWENLYRKYPKVSGIIWLSEIGFNSDQTQALVYVTHGCGATRGEGGYFLLAKESGAWKVVTEIMVMAA